MEKKSVNSSNSFGTISVTFGILSIIFSILLPFLGIVFGVISFVFAVRQKKANTNKWSKSGMILAIIGILLSLIIWILLVTVLAPYINQFLQTSQIP